MSFEEQEKHLITAEIRALRALRLSLTVLVDAAADIVENLPGDPNPGDTDETEAERIKIWNVLKPLLLSAAKSIETFTTNGFLGAECAQQTVRQCEATLELIESDRIAKRVEPLLEELRTVPKDTKEYEIICLKALTAGFRDEVEEKPEPIKPTLQEPLETEDDHEGEV